MLIYGEFEMIARILNGDSGVMEPILWRLCLSLCVDQICVG